MNYPTQNLKLRNRKNLSISAFVFLFLIVFTPFGIQEWTYPERFYYVLGYGLCTLLGMYAWDIIRPVFLEKVRGIRPSQRQLVDSFSTLMIISAFNFVYSFMIGLIDLSLQSLLIFVSITVAVGIFPSAFFYYKASESKRKEMNPVKPETEENEAEPILRLEGDNQDEILRLATGELLFIKAALNYSEVFFLKEGALQREILRVSMNRVEEQLEQPYICRTHRSYICNLQNVKDFSRKNKGLELEFDGVNETACCSRKHKDVILQKLNSIADSAELNYA